VDVIIHEILEMDGAGDDNIPSEQEIVTNKSIPLVIISDMWYAN